MRRSVLVLTLAIVACLRAGFPQGRLAEIRRSEPPRGARGEPLTPHEREEVRRVECAFMGCGDGFLAGQDNPNVVNLNGIAAAKGLSHVHKGLGNFHDESVFESLEGRRPLAWQDKLNERGSALKSLDPWNGKPPDISNRKPSDVLNAAAKALSPVHKGSGNSDDELVLKSLDPWNGKPPDIFKGKLFKWKPDAEGQDIWDSPEVRAAIDRRISDSELLTFNQKNPRVRAVRVELEAASLSNRYKAYDGHAEPVYSGNDLGSLIRNLSNQFDSGEGSIVIGLSGFTANQSLAFATELNVQQELFHPSHEWRPLASARPDLVSLYNQAGMTLEGMILTKVETPAVNQDSWHIRMRFTDGIRKFWVWIHTSSRDQFKEFVGYFANLLFSPAASNWSPGLAAQRTRKQLLANHPELTESQLSIEIRYEIGSTHLGELLISTPPKV